MAEGPDIVVAGAGVLGLSCALRLAQAGARVRVLDPAPAGANASGVAAGMLAPVFESVLDTVARPHFDLLAAARDLWPALAEETGIVLRREPTMAVGEAAWLARTAEALAGLGVAPRRLERGEIEAAAPDLHSRFVRGLSAAGDWRLEPGPALAALRSATARAGVAFHKRAAAPDEPCDLLVAAVGADPGLAERAPELARLVPIRGHILRYSGVLSTMLRADGLYAAPQVGGLVVGATMEPGVRANRVDPVQVERLRAEAAALFPNLAGAPAQAAVGIRAATPDGLPLAGPGSIPGVLVAAGARRNGWLLAPLVAQVIAAHALGGDPGPYAARLDPRRFNRPR